MSVNAYNFAAGGFAASQQPAAITAVAMRKRSVSGSPSSRNAGLRYYVDVRDESHNCYIDRLNEGRYYVEYDLWVRHAGTFECGIGVLRSVYAPEFRANTPSVKLRVAE